MGLSVSGALHIEMFIPTAGVNSDLLAICTSTASYRLYCYGSDFIVPVTTLLSFHKHPRYDSDQIGFPYPLPEICAPV
jgi:hypothetical protein